MKLAVVFLSLVGLHAVEAGVKVDCLTELGCPYGYWAPPGQQCVSAGVLADDPDKTAEQGAAIGTDLQDAIDVCLSTCGGKSACLWGDCPWDDPAGPCYPGTGTGSGDPHFKTWTGDKFDYHGECDLVLLDNPSFNNDQGIKVHIRTTRVQYFSYIERVAIQIGQDVLEFANDVNNFMINGKVAEANKKHHKTMLGGFVVRRDPKSLSIRLRDGTGDHKKDGAAKIDLKVRKNGFPAVIVDGGSSDIFKGSLGLLGEWETGKKLSRDGVTELALDNEEENTATAFALEWQVRDTEPLLFVEARAPQYPAVCVPPAKMMESRLGMQRMREKAEEACAHWGDDKSDCIFDVVATRDIQVAVEGRVTAAY